MKTACFTNGTANLIKAVNNLNSELKNSEFFITKIVKTQKIAIIT